MLLGGLGNADATLFDVQPATHHPGAVLTPAAVTPTVLPAIPSIARAAAQPFGLEKARPVRGRLHDKWTAAKNEMQAERLTLMACREDPESCPANARKFLAVVDKALARDGWARVAEINRSINLNITPADDADQYGVVDRWASPLTTFTSNAGDCEDYAIAKYAALREAGIRENDLRLVVVYDRARREHHAVTAVRHAGNWLVLDNRTHEMRRDIEIAQFDPMFVIDKAHVRRIAAATAKQRAAAR